jgi:hypothetical protein
MHLDIEDVSGGSATRGFLSADSRMSITGSNRNANYSVRADIDE